MQDDPPDDAVQIDIVSVQGGRGDGNGNDRRFPPEDRRQFPKTCFLCREPTDLVCRGCNIICYCSREHQIQCRPRHRLECPRGAETGYVIIQTARYETRKDAYTWGYCLDCQANGIPVAGLEVQCNYCNQCLEGTICRHHDPLFGGICRRCRPEG